MGILKLCKKTFYVVSIFSIFIICYGTTNPSMIHITFLIKKVSWHRYIDPEPFLVSKTQSSQTYFYHPDLDYKNSPNMQFFGYLLSHFTHSLRLKFIVMFVILFSIGILSLTHTHTPLLLLKTN